MQDMPDVLERVTPLAGAWTGQGRGQFPTIAAFDYREDLRFELDMGRRLIHYEQRATHRQDGSLVWVASHWESGFLRPMEDGSLEMTNCQDSGRLEIIRFEVSSTPTGVRLVGASTQLFNDPRMVRTRREFEVEAGALRYQVTMTTTRVPDGELHLSARLTRS